MRRDDEIAAVAKRLQRKRTSVLLVGEGGVGKTAALVAAVRTLERRSSPDADERTDGTAAVRERFWLTSGARIIGGMQYPRQSRHTGGHMGKPTGLVQGTLDLLVLRTIEHEPRHGWAIPKRIQQVSNEVLKVQQRSLYPALYRLEKEGLIAGRWGATDTGREAKFYALTRAGRTHLKREAASWAQLSAAIDLVLREA